MRVAIIPARGGSKRVPRKNVRPFAGKPMIAWPIGAALESGLFDRVVVSTDDQEIAEAARTAGAETPFVRPAELANDVAATRPVIQHAIREIEARYGLPDFVCTIFATAPFVEPDDLKAALAALQEGDWAFAFSVGTFPSPIQRALKRAPNGGVAMVEPQHRFTRSQDLEEAFHDAGQFYFARTQAYLDETPMFGERSVPIVLPRWRVHDIDTEEDWRLAELVFEALRRERAR